MLILNESKIFSIVYYSTAADKSASHQMLSEQSSTFLVFVTPVFQNILGEKLQCKFSSKQFAKIFVIATIQRFFHFNCCQLCIFLLIVFAATEHT
jgi:hypothetical protein